MDAQSRVSGSSSPYNRNVGGPARAMSNMDPELLRARQFMQEKICHVIQQRLPNQPMNERKFRDIVKRLEEGLLRSSVTKEDYMNLDTLESRLHNLIKCPPPTNQSQQYPQVVNSSSSLDASMITASGSTSTSPTTVSSGNLLPVSGLLGSSFNRADGSMSNGYQQAPAQSHISGQISGLVPNQEGTQLPVPPHPLSNVDPELLSSRQFMQEKMIKKMDAQSRVSGSSSPYNRNVGGPARAMSNIDPELLRARQFMQEKICHVIQQRQPNQPMNERKFRDIVKRLEEGLLRSSVTKEDYMNLDTLESRLHNLIKRPPPTNQNQQYPQLVNSSSSLDASMITASGSTSTSPTTVSSGNLLPVSGLLGSSFNRADGSMSNGYQQAPAQSHISGQISGLVPNQEGTQLPVPPHPLSNVDPELLSSRQFMQEKICHLIQQQQLHWPMNERKFRAIIKRLEEDLWRASVSKEDYMNLDTLENRLYRLIKHRSLSDQ